MTISPNRVIQSVNSQESLRHQISIDQTNQLNHQLNHQPITAKKLLPSVVTPDRLGWRRFKERQPDPRCMVEWRN